MHTNGIRLSPRQEAARLKRLEAATGVGDQRGYDWFRGIIVAAAKLRIKPELHCQRCLPQPGGVEYRPEPYRRKGTAVVDDYPYIIAPNHSSAWDIIIVGMWQRCLIWICKATWGLWSPGSLFFRMGAVPLFRPTRDGDPTRNSERKIKRLMKYSLTSQEAEDRATAALKRGVPAVTFPQGTRVKDGMIDSARNGLARLALRTGCAIVPVGIAGCAEGDPEVREGLLRRRVIVGVVGRPISPADFSHLSLDAAISAVMESWRQEVNALRQEAIGFLGSRQK